MIDPELRGKIALVTGVDLEAGIGASIAAALATQGVDLLITLLPSSHDLSTGADPQRVEQRLRAFGVRAAAYSVDLSDPEVAPVVFDQAELVLGPVSILVNNAAVAAPDRFVERPGTSDFARRSVLDLTAESHDRHFAVNSRASALLMAEYARRHIAAKRNWGRIINISTEGADGFAGEVSYGASKAALESYSRAAARELAPYGVTVNIVAPGPIQTGWIPADLESVVSADTPLGRVGRPEDVSDVVVFLASHQARWVTGQRLFVGGGHRM
jgi:3-oxoacyl-[acyl-carrier protein] reductase